MKWHSQKLKTIKLDPERGRIQVEETPAQIIKEPNRCQIESVISALCVSVSELIAIQDAQAERVSEITKQLSQIKVPLKVPLKGLKKVKS